MAKKYTFEEVRVEHSKAYAPWSKDEDEIVEFLFCRKVSVAKIAILLERQKGAVLSRIRRLELREK